MRFRLLSVGKASAVLADAIAEYERRAARYWPLDVVEVKAAGARSRAPADVRRDEGERLASHVRGTLVALHEAGRSLDSQAFAAWMQGQRERPDDVTFVIGGAFGLDRTLLARAQVQLSLAPWTLPHDVARLVLVEQLYRAGTIHRGEPYHKE